MLSSTGDTVWSLPARLQLTQMAYLRMMLPVLGERVGVSGSPAPGGPPT